MQSLTEQKNKLRKSALSFRKSLDKSEKLKKDETIFKKLIALDTVRNCKTLLCYISLENEIDTSKLLRFCFENSINIAVPKCLNGEVMKFYFITGEKDLEKGMYGISEPKNYCAEYTFDDNSVCVVPALSADKSGFRLGYGKGYYDRFLSNFKGKSIVLVYKENLVEKLVTDKYDCCCDLVVTD